MVAPTRRTTQTRWVVISDQSMIQKSKSTTVNSTQV